MTRVDSDRLLAAGTLAGASCIGLGAAVLAGWHLQSVTLIQIRPDWAPMQVNTALAFVLAGLALLAMRAGQRVPARFLATLVGSVGLLTLLEYVTGVDLGIDTLLLDPFTSTATSDPGRMSPNTALCFVLAGAAILVLGKARPSALRVASLWLLVCLVLALGIAAGIGYGLGIEGRYGGGSLSRMAAHTAAGFVVLGLGLLGFVWADSQAADTTALPALPAMAFVCTVLPTLLLWQELQVRERTNLDALVGAEAAQVAHQVTTEMGLRAAALRHQATDLESAGELPLAVWEAHAREFVDFFPGFAAIAWVDPSLRVRRVAPFPGNEDLLDLDLGGAERVRDGLAAGRERDRTLGIDGISLLEGRIDFLLVSPLFARGEFGGFLVATAKLEDLIDGILQEPAQAGLPIVVLHRGREIFASAEGPPADPEAWRDERMLDAAGLAWRVVVWPRPDHLAAARSPLPAVALAAGVLLGALLSLAVHLGQRAALRAREVESARGELERRVEERTAQLQDTNAALRKSEAAEHLQSRILEILAAEPDDSMYSDVLDLVREAFQCELGFFGYIREEDGALVCPSMTRGVFERCEIPGKSIEFPRAVWGGIFGPVLLEGRCLYKNEPHQVPERHLPLSNSLGAPLLHGGEVVGSIHVANRPSDFGEEDREALERITSLIAPVLHARLQRERGETYRKMVMRSLEESEARLHRMVAEAPFPIMLHAEDGAILMVNRTWTELAGYSPSEIPTIAAWTERAYGSQAGRVRSDVSRLYGASDRAREGEYVITTKTGEQRTWEFSSAPLGALPDGRKLVMSMAVDLTDRKRAEELARSNTELEQFAYVASHDLQEPLRMVASYTELLARRYRGRLDADADEFIGYAVDGAHRMQQLIRDLLTYSRVGTRAETFRESDCEVVLTTALTDLQAAIEESEAVVTHDPLPTVHGDTGQLVQVLENLIGNAIKFRGDRPSRVHVSAAREGDAFVFSVWDNGIGIDPAYAERIFRIFQRLHGGEKYPGTGIGLAICRRIVERHGGRIWVESRPGRGATFRFTIPVIGGVAAQEAS